MLNFIKFICKACGAEFKTNDWSWDGAHEIAECPMCRKMCPCVKVQYTAKGR